MNNKVSLIYCTCDKYESLWDGFFTLWKKYWPEFDAPIILNTETKEFSFSGYSFQRPTFSKTNPTWSERLFASLELVNTPYVILSLDDFYLKSKVDTETIRMCVEKMDADKTVDLFTFGWQPGRNRPCDFSEKFEKRARFAPYRVNAQIGLWRVSYLKRIIKLYESPWEFELNGSFRSTLMGGGVYSLKKNTPLVFDYDWGFLIVRGQLNRKVASYFEKNENISFAPSFPDLDLEAYQSKGKKKHPLRYVKYLAKMVGSVFR